MRTLEARLVVIASPRSVQMMLQNVNLQDCKYKLIKKKIEIGVMLSGLDLSNMTVFLYLL